MRIAFMSGVKVDFRLPGVPKIHDVFDDKFEWWIAYPLSLSAVLHRPTLYLRERCRLAGFFQEMQNLIFECEQEHSVAIREYAKAVEFLVTKMKHWYGYLPFELHYQWPMSVAVWELQYVQNQQCCHFGEQLIPYSASYLAFLMTLLLVARVRFQRKQEARSGRNLSTEADDDEAKFKLRMAQDMLACAIPLAYSAAQYLREFRMRYGLKITPAWLLQLQAVTAGVLVLDPELANVTVVPCSRANDDQYEAIHDSRSAFDEVFRSLLGTGVEVMIARGIARMMYHTALEQNIVLS
jgi:hypothetical protein